MKDILIIGNNSIQEKAWIEKMKNELSNDNNIHTISVSENNSIQDIINLNQPFFNSKSKKIVITTLSASPFVDKLSNAGYLDIKLCLCVSKENMNNNPIDYNFVNKKYKNIIFQFLNNNDTFDNKNCLNVPLVPIHTSIENIKEYIHYIRMYLLVNNNETIYEKIISNDMSSAISIIDNDRTRYKYVNNWLFDPSNKILSFSYNGEKYIAKRTTKQKASTEIANAKILKKLIDGLKIDSFKLNIIIPEFYDINAEYGYLVTKFYGKDLNQIYYDQGNSNLQWLGKLYKSIKYILESNNLIHNGFIPRNIILNDKNVYLIDFEDINKKNNAFSETTQGIAWSYFINLDINNIANILNCEKNIDLPSNMKNLISNYPNMYKLALIAESSYNSSRKLDDIVNILSEYLNYEIELILDILLYEQSINNISTNIEEMLYSLTEKIKIIAPFSNSLEIEKIVKLDIKNILLSIQNKIKTLQLNETIEYAKVKINK